MPLNSESSSPAIFCVIAEAIALLAMSGCSSQPVPRVRSGETIGMQLQRVDPALKQQRFSNLLSFETDADLAFITSADGTSVSPVKFDETISHTGSRSLRLPEPWRGMSVRTDALMAGGQLAGEWALMGGYFYSEQPAEVRLAFVDPTNGGSERTAVVKLEPRAWTPVFIDAATELPTTRPMDLVSRFRAEFRATSPVWFDDMLLIDNTQTVAAKIDDGDSDWAITLRGKRYFGTAATGEKFEIPAKLATSDSGWKLDQVDAMRAIFRDGQRVWAVYSNGRAYLDRKFSPVVPCGDVAADQHAAPAEIDALEESARVVRNSVGDIDNDGYNESLGSYELQARNSRMSFILRPRSAILDRPVVEIAGLPPGRVLVTVEGRLVEKVVRLPSGRVLIELPGDIRRPVEVSVSTRAEQAGIVP